MIDLAPSNRTDDKKGFGTLCHGFGERVIRREVGELLIAGEEADEGATEFAGVVTHGALQHRVLCLECVENGSLRDGAFDGDLYEMAHFGEQAEIRW